RRRRRDDRLAREPGLGRRERPGRARLRPEPAGGLAMATRKFDSPPSSLGIYGRALLGVIPGTGSLPLIGGREDDIPQDVLELDATAERERVARYCKVCGFTLRNTLPPTYPHILAFPLHMAMVTD